MSQLTLFPERKFSYKQLSEEVLQQWKEENTYEKLREQNKIGEEFRFVDGPPFVSSKDLHMGHILVSTIKSTKLFYEQMQGKNVRNKIGYDCHGLPIEMAVQKLLKIATKEEIEIYGIDAYNAKCKELVQSYSTSWHQVFDKIGRWRIHLHNHNNENNNHNDNNDNDNESKKDQKRTSDSTTSANSSSDSVSNSSNSGGGDRGEYKEEDEYKTMDRNYMESVWWAFKTLQEKGLVYKGYKIMPYSTGCGTALSNFEANQNYKSVVDPSVYVTFPLVDMENTSFLAWTTTPWTLPCNLALCVHPSLPYVRVYDPQSQHYYIVSEHYAHLHYFSSSSNNDNNDNKKLNDNKNKNKNKRKVSGVNNNNKKSAADQTCSNNNNNNSAINDACNQSSSSPDNGKEVNTPSPPPSSSSSVEKEEARIVDRYQGKDLIGKRYTPIFPFYTSSNNNSSSNNNDDDGDNEDKENESKFFQVIGGNHVTMESGTGIVHTAPGFGEDDFNVCVENGIVNYENIYRYCPIDAQGRYTEPITDYLQTYVMDANQTIINDLSRSNRLVREEPYRHDYPMCWRTDTPLLYKADFGIFIRVTSISESLLRNADQMQFFPDHIRTGRFRSWLLCVNDWAVSRSRFFGTPIPIWISDDGEEMVTIGSVEELLSLSTSPLSDLPDLHPEVIRTITIRSSRGPDHPPLKNIGLVFDCWFESGCAPFAQFHYPFEESTRTQFNDVSYLCDFLCEGLDQTRGWFYTLLVLSTALFDLPPAKFVVCSGLILDEKGQKICKSKGNFVPPLPLIDRVGPDALRVYLLSSPATAADVFKFNEKDIEVFHTRLYQWYNSVVFLVDQIIVFNKNGFTLDPSYYLLSTNITDRWILSRCGSTAEAISRIMPCCRFPDMIRALFSLDDDLRNWYLKVFSLFLFFFLLLFNFLFYSLIFIYLFILLLIYFIYFHLIFFGINIKLLSYDW